MFSICSYEAETEEAINLVEGEKVYIIGNVFTFCIINNIALISVVINTYLQNIYFHSHLFPNRSYQSGLVVCQEALDRGERLGTSAVSTKRSALYCLLATKIAREDR